MGLDKEATVFHYLGVLPAMLMARDPLSDDADHRKWIGIGATREQEVKACVILHEGTDDGELIVQELIHLCEGRLAYFKIPRYWAFKRKFPVTRTGKVQKQLLKTETSDPTAGSYDRVRKRWV